MKPLKTIELFAWLGEDELGSGEIGIKQALVPAGMIPIVAVNLSKVNRASIMQAMGKQAEDYGKKIYLCRFTFAEVIWATHGGEPPL
jgi:hypothetical protein